LWQLLSTALPATLVPYLSPLPIDGHAPDVWKVLSWHVTVCAVIGAVVWWRRHRDAAIVLVPVYLAETLWWPYINERRVILVLPVVAVWYVLGAQAIGRALLAGWRSARWRPLARPDAARQAILAASVIAVVFVIGPLAVQMPRDYLLDLGQNTSHFAGSRYVSILSHVGTSADVVETDYVSSTALFTGHSSRAQAFRDTLTSCDPGVVQADLASDDAGFLLLGNLNKPGVLDSPCLYSLASTSPWAVQLLQTGRDQASVFELIGPGTGHPELHDLTSSATQSASITPADVATFEWDWASLAPLTQVSVGEAASAGSTTSVVLQLRGADDRWRTVSESRSAVGDGNAAAPYLLASLPPATEASALRLVISGSGAPAFADVHALGPGNLLFPTPAPAGHSGPGATS
jgi:hypothetical protein